MSLWLCHRSTQKTILQRITSEWNFKDALWQTILVSFSQELLYSSGWDMIGLGISLCPWAPGEPPCLLCWSFHSVTACRHFGDPWAWLTNVISSWALSVESFSSVFVVEAFWNQRHESQRCSCFVSTRSLHPQPFNTFPSISPTISQITYTDEQESILSSGHVSSPYKVLLLSVSPWEGLSPLSFKATSGTSARTSVYFQHASM